jgi:hypothetical protein
MYFLKLSDLCSSYFVSEIVTHCTISCLCGIIVVTDVREYELLRLDAS